MKNLCVDFDRVIHSYTTPWSGTTSIPDPPNKGAFQWLTEVVQHFDVYVFSCRCEDPSSEAAMKAWMRQHGLSEEVIAKLRFTNQKPAAILYIDDRSFHFQGSFPTVDAIKAFKPWHPADDLIDAAEKMSQLSHDLASLASERGTNNLLCYRHDVTVGGLKFRVILDRIED